ncbi:MAG: adenylosuccinate lyase [Bacteriovoracaceae bacterium]|nr:adenylosuccinate lyase [Bacteriovoracaceae bacterium]
MIPRYDRKEISTIWTDQYKFSTYLKVELAILKAMEGSKVPEGISAKVEKDAVINPERIDEIEQTVKHDVIAFCTSITENLEPEVAKYFHYGVTSSDVIDSALTLQIKDSLEVIIPTFKTLLNSLYKRAEEMKNVACLGRSHGMYAEPMSFGQKLLGHYNEFARRFQELEDFYNTELTIQFSGAVGNYTIMTPEYEKDAADSLGVKVEPVSTQVIPRDRIAKLVNLGALIGCAIERLSVEIRHLHRSDVNELHEGFTKGQKGSSIMPHKKNPISGENLTGMARMLRSHAIVAQENVILWHERDISHSSTERMYLPDHLGILQYSLARLAGTVDRLEFHQDVIENRVKENFTYLSSYYLHLLISGSDFRREDLYMVMQEASFEGSKEKSMDVFYDTMMKLLREKDISVDLPRPTFDEIKKTYLGNVEKVFKRSLEIYPVPN